MGFKVTDVGASVANKLVLDEEHDATNPAAEHTADAGSANDAQYRMDGLDGEDRTHTFSSELSQQGVAIFNYSMQDRMSGDGGSTNKAGYINFGPVRSDDLDEAKKREREADEYLAILLEQSEAARRLAELDARIAQLEAKVKELETKIEANQSAQQLLDDPEIHDNTLNGMAKREKLKQELINAGIDPSGLLNPDGTIRREAEDRYRLLLRQDERRLREETERTKRELDRAYNQRAAELEGNRDRNVGQIKASLAGDPAATAEVRNQSSTGSGFRELGTTILDNPTILSRDDQARALTQTGLLSSDKAVAVTSSPDDVLGSVASLGFSTDLPPAAPAMQTARLPETLPELLAPVNSLLPPDMKIPAPNIKLIDLIPPGILTGANAPATPRATGSFAAELGMDDTASGIKPISGTFARATNGEIPAEAVASADATLAATVAEKDRVASYSTGTSGAGGMKV